MKSLKHKKFMIVLLAFLVWIIVFSVDYSRAANMKRPYFMIETISKDGTSRNKSYLGLGYWGSATRFEDSESLSNVEFNLLWVQLLHLFG